MTDTKRIREAVRELQEAIDLNKAVQEINWKLKRDAQLRTQAELKATFKAN